MSFCQRFHQKPALIVTSLFSYYGHDYCCFKLCLHFSSKRLYCLLITPKFPLFEVYHEKNWFISTPLLPISQAIHADVPPVSLCKTITRHAKKMMLLQRQLKWKAREITTTTWTKKRKNWNRLSSARQTIMSTVALEIVMSLAVKRSVDAQRVSLQKRRNVSTRTNANMETTSAVIRVTMWKAVTSVLVHMVSACQKTRKLATISTSVPTTTKFADQWSAATHTEATDVSVKMARKWMSMAGATLPVYATMTTAGAHSKFQSFVQVSAKWPALLSTAPVGLITKKSFANALKTWISMRT